VSSICLHHLRDFQCIGEIYGEVREHLKPGGVFLNLDLVNAPTPDLEERYGAVAAAKRQHAEGSRENVEALVPHAAQSPAPGTAGHFPATVDEQLRALRAAGFNNVDCFWKDLRRSLVGGYA
jgi:tRNA (cmo5U34)-methyltransferase